MATLATFKPTPRRVAAVLGIGGLVVTLGLQILLGSDPLVAGLAALSGGAVLALVLWRPRALASWYAAYMYLQLFGIAWIVKSTLLLKFESGLMLPAESIGWGSLFVLTACATAWAIERGSSRAPLANLVFGDGSAWERVGISLLVVGEIAHYLSYAASQGAEDPTKSFGGFETLRGLSIAATCFFAAAAANRGKLLSKWVVIALSSGLLNALIFSQKAELVLRTMAVVGIYLASDGPISRKLRLVVAAPVLFLIMNSLVFPVVHATRDIRDKNLPMGERITLLKSALSEKVDSSKYEKGSFGNIWNENVHFLPTENWFLMRFGSIAYFDVTAKFGEPGSSKMTAGDFFDRSLSKALPAGLYGEKDPYSLADRLWYDLDTRIQPGGFLTMGTYASARLVFGSWPGYLVTTALLAVILLLSIRIYGHDIRMPLAMYLFINVFYVLNDGDLDHLTGYLMRFLWQDLVILIAVKYIGDASRTGLLKLFRRSAR